MPQSLLAKKKHAELFEAAEQVLEKVKVLAAAGKKATGFCIGNTTKKVSHDHFFTPIRNTAFCTAGSIIIDKVSIAEALTRYLDGRVDYLFVDTEKKISPDLYGAHDVGNVERVVRRLAVKSKVLTYKGNDITVDAIDCFLAQLVVEDERGLGRKKVAVVGAGNIGFKIALKLTERGAHVVMVRRDIRKLEAVVRALNLIKPESTIAKITGSSDIKKALKDADIVIGLTPGTQDITDQAVALLKPNAVLIDAGKGSFSRSALDKAARLGFRVFRTSIAASFEGQVAMLLAMEKTLSRSLGRKVLSGIPIVSAGLLGRKNEIIVDDITDPTEVYGVADGCGDFIHHLSAQQKKDLDRLKELIGRD